MLNPELTKSFFETIIKDFEKNDSISITNVEVEQACEKGLSFITDVKRVKLYGSMADNDENYYRSLIVKQLPSKEQQKLFRSKIAASNEHKAYTKIIAALNRYAVEELPVPKCLFSTEEIIILEDLIMNGYKGIHLSLEGLTVPECTVVLKGLAKFHAASFVLEHNEPEHFLELSTMIQEVLFVNEDSTLLDFQIKWIESYTKTLQTLPASKHQQMAIELLNELKENGRSRMKNILLNPRELSVICHGDLWVSNFMFNQDKKLMLLDLQLMRYNSVARDLSYLLSINLQPQIRFENEDNLLDVYLKNLCQNIKAKGLNMDSTLTKEWLRSEMERFKEFGLMCAMWVIPVFYIKKESMDISNPNKKFDDGGELCQKRVTDLILKYVENLN